MGKKLNREVCANDIFEYVK